MVRGVSDTIKNVRDNIDEYHGKWFKEAIDLAQSVNVVPSMPRTWSRQVHFENNYSFSRSTTYAKPTVSIPFLDEQFERQFSSIQQNSLAGLSLIPSIFLMDQVSSRAQIKKFAEE